MCDPLVGGLIAGAASIAAGAAQASQMADLQQKQQNANDQWVAYQTKIHQQQMAAEDQAREAANQAREATLQKVSPEAQQEAQTTEQQRLQNIYANPANAKSGGTGATGTPSSDPTSQGFLLSGDTTGNQNPAAQDLAAKVNMATTAARQRIGALATAGSYGGTFGGLGTVVPQAFAQGGNYINLVNDIRQGNLKTYGVEQQVQPVNYAAGPGSGMLGSIANTLGGLAGKGLGAAAAGGFGGWGGGGGGIDPFPQGVIQGYPG